MAATTTTTMDDVVLAAAIEAQVIDYARAAAVMPPLMLRTSLAGRGSKVAQFPKWGSLAASGLTEGTDMSNTAISSTNVQATVAEVGVRLDVTDLLALTSSVDLSAYARQAGLALADKLDDDAIALFTSLAGNSVGSSGVELTLDVWQEAIFKLEEDNAPGPYVAVLHPRQIFALRKLIAGTSGSTATFFGGSTPDLSAKGPGFAFNLMGVDVYGSSNVDAVNANADYCGAIFSVGACFGMAELWPAKVSLQRDESLRATEINVTSCYGLVELVDNFGCKVISKLAA